MLAGIPDYALAVSGTTNNSLRSHGVSTYVQDDIHVVPRLLLNVGLRYEYNSPPVEAQNHFSVPDLVACTALPCVPTFSVVGTNGIPRATYSPTYTNFAPRIGIAWRPLKSERWVVRSAYGIFYDSSIANINIFPRINPPFYDLALFPQTFNCVAGPGLPCIVQDILNQVGQTTGVVQGNMISPQFRDGYMQQWNTDLQYEVLPNWMVDVAYVGSKGTHLSDVLDKNQPDPVTGLPPYPQFSSILYVESNANSSYNSLQLRSEKRTSHGLALLLSYTYSKSFDDISSVFGGSVGSGLPQNSRDLPADRGPSDFNAVNRFSGSFVYDLPVHRLWNNGPARLLNDWQASGIVTAQSGSPFTVVLARRAGVFGGGIRQSRTARSGGRSVRSRASGREPNLPVFRPQSSADAAELVQSLRLCPLRLAAFGTEGRNILTGPGFTNIDFSLSKSVALRSENHRLQFRGDFFNLFNHPNFDIPGHVFGLARHVCGACWSRPMAMAQKPPRQIQLSLRYGF